MSRKEKSVVALEAAVGFNFAHGLHRARFRLAPHHPVRRLVEDLDRITVRFQESPTYEIHSSLDLERECEKLLDHFGPEVWPDRCPDWLLNKDVEPDSDHPYIDECPKPLRHSNLDDKLQLKQRLCQLLVKKCVYKAGNYRHQKGKRMGDDLDYDSGLSIRDSTCEANRETKRSSVEPQTPASPRLPYRDAWQAIGGACTDEESHSVRDTPSSSTTHINVRYSEPSQASAGPSTRSKSSQRLHLGQIPTTGLSKARNDTSSPKREANVPERAIQDQYQCTNEDLRPGANPPTRVSSLHPTPEIRDLTPELAPKTNGSDSLNVPDKLMAVTQNDSENITALLALAQQLQARMARPPAATVEAGESTRVNGNATMAFGRSPATSLAVNRSPTIPAETPKTMPTPCTPNLELLAKSTILIQISEDASASELMDLENCVSTELLLAAVQDCLDYDTSAEHVGWSHIVIGRRDGTKVLHDQSHESTRLRFGV